MIWFVVGAIIMMALLFYRIPYQTVQGHGHIFQGYLAAAVIGAILFGTPMWLISLLF